MNSIIALLVLIMVPAKSVSGQNSISGVVLEQTGGTRELISGANVYWSGTLTGTTTDLNGRFELEPSMLSNQLVVSFVGFKADTILVKEPVEELEIFLEPLQHLDEVIIAAREPGAHISRLSPVTVINITSAELYKAPCCTLAESFETNASVDVTFTDAATGAKRIQLLGLSGTYVQMLTENMHLSRGLSSVYGLDFIPGPWMESIQVSKGAATVNHGYESLTGQINVQYKSPTTSEALFVNGFASSGGRLEANVNTGFKVSETLNTAILAHSASVSRENDHKGDGFLDEPLIKRNTFMNKWEFRPNRQIFTQFGAKILEEERVGGQTTFNKRVSPFEQDAYGIIVNSGNLETYFKTGYISPRDGNRSVALVSHFTRHEHESIFGRRFYNASQDLFGLNLIYSSYFGNPTKHDYIIGVSYKYDGLSEEFWGNLVNEPITDRKRTEHVKGLYFQYTYCLPQRITLLAGLRGDYHNWHGILVTPRLHMKYSPVENLIFRVSAGKGYRTPNALAENNPLLASSRRVVIHDDITLESGWNYGVNITNYINIARRELTLNLEYFRTVFQDQLIVDLDRNSSEIHFYNLDGESYSNVFQVEAAIEVLRDLDVVAAWRFNDVMVTTNNTLQRKALTGRYRGLLNLSYATPMRRWQFDFTTQFNGPGRVPITAVHLHEHATGNNEFEPFQIHNFQVTRFLGNWSFYTGIENIGNFTQHNPVIGAASPFGDTFDSSLVWGPLMGRKFYFGFRFTIDRGTA